VAQKKIQQSKKKPLFFHAMVGLELSQFQHGTGYLNTRKVCVKTYREPIALYFHIATQVFGSDHYPGPVSADLQGPVMPRKLAPRQWAKNALKLIRNPGFFCMA
jgi:hypothetical protein